jgi:hypothetical protein
MMAFLFLTHGGGMEREQTTQGWAKVKSVARYTDTSESTVREWLKAGLQHARLPSGNILVELDAIDNYLSGFVTEENQVGRIVAEFLEEVSK